MKRLALLVGLAVLAVGCTKQEAKTAVDIAAEVCQGVLDLTHPTMAPICFTAQEIADAIIALARRNGAMAVPPTWESIRAEIMVTRLAKEIGQ